MKDNNEYPEKGVKIPEWEHCSKKVDNKENLTAMERFIYDNEPAGDGYEQPWRDQLQVVLDELQPANNDYAVKVIEGRIVKLEKLQSEFRSTNNTYHELGYIIIELKGIIQALLIPNN